MKINQTLLMSDARHFSATQAINPYYFDSRTDSTLAQAEHEAIRDALEYAGATVITAASPEDSQDGVYVANWALVRGDKAVLARLPNVRSAEEQYARSVLEGLGKRVIEVPDNLRFSGQGDALACGPYLFCGKGYRSDEAAQAFAADVLGYRRIQLQTIPQRDAHGVAVINNVSGWPDSFFYDIDLALAVIRYPITSPGQSTITPGLIAYCPDAFTAESVQKIKNLKDIETIEVSLDEAKHAFACNLVSTGEVVVMSDKAPGLKTALEARGLIVKTPHVQELGKGGGYIRCTTLTLD